MGNLALRRESINEVAYQGRFDYVICTGVIHHNARPSVALAKLARALRPAGLLELMVYNQFHRVLTTAFQRALRAFLGNKGKPDVALELPLARRLVRSYRGSPMMMSFLKQQAGVPDAAFADNLMQPVEQSYTVETLAEMVSGCGLELLHFCVDQFSAADDRIDWNLTFEDPELQAVYDGLDDQVRWHISNCLLLNESPYLWFYVQRADSGRRRKTESELAVEFLRQGRASP